MLQASINDNLNWCPSCRVNIVSGNWTELKASAFLYVSEILTYFNPIACWLLSIISNFRVVGIIVMAENRGKYIYSLPPISKFIINHWIAMKLVLSLVCECASTLYSQRVQKHIVFFSDELLFRPLLAAAPRADLVQSVMSLFDPFGRGMGDQPVWLPDERIYIYNVSVHPSLPWKLPRYNQLT